MEVLLILAIIWLWKDDIKEWVFKAMDEYKDRNNG